MRVVALNRTGLGFSVSVRGMNANVGSHVVRLAKTGKRLPISMNGISGKSIQYLLSVNTSRTCKGQGNLRNRRATRSPRNMRMDHDPCAVAISQTPATARAEAPTGMADRINEDTHSSDDNKIERGCSSWYGALHWGHMITVPGRS